MVTISGIFLDPDGAPVPGAVITFTQLKNTTDSFLRRDATMTTAADGSYRVQLYNGRYKVMAKYQNNSEAKLGEITVSDSSRPGTLNDYLLVGTADDIPSPLFSSIEKMYFEMLELVGDLSSVAKSVDGRQPDEAGNIALNAYTPANPPPIYIPPTWDAPGSTVFGYYSVSAGESYLSPGDIVAASQIRVGAVQIYTKNGVTAPVAIWVSHPSGGSWRLQGSTGRRDLDPQVTVMNCCLCWLRVDGLLQQPQLLKSASGPKVRNCRYSEIGIDCEIYMSGQWLPFTASPNDSTEYGPLIYANAVAGMYGPVKGAQNSAH